MTDQPNKNPNKSPGGSGKQALFISILISVVFAITLIIGSVNSSGDNLTQDAKIESYVMVTLGLVYLGFIIGYCLFIIFMIISPTYIVYQMYTQIKYRITKQASNTFFLDIVISIIIGIPTSIWILYTVW